MSTNTLFQTPDNGEPPSSEEWEIFSHQVQDTTSNMVIAFLESEENWRTNDSNLF